jgi:acyl-coenzyme A thioesterase PaaI-like protein
MQKLPNSSYCFVCGLENPHGLKLTFYQDGPASVICQYTVPDRFQGYPGVVHGGIVTSIMDEALGRVFMIDDHNRFMFTAKLTTRFRKNVPIETPLTITARVLKDRGRIAESSAQLFGPDGDLLAEAQGLLVALPDEFAEKGSLDDLGWRVYPDEEPAG